MIVLVCPRRDEIGKFQGLVWISADMWTGSLLDVGCRAGNLKNVLPDTVVRYCGLDLFPPADVIGNLEAGLPFESVSFDAVVALDVLEHTDNIYKAFSELCRVALTSNPIRFPSLSTKSLASPSENSHR